MEVRPIQWDFKNGISGPKYRGKVGVEQATNALESGLNVMVSPTGSLFRRPGTFNLAENYGDARLESFEFSDGTSYVLAFTSGVIKVHANDAAFTLKATINPSGITGSAVDEFDIDQSFDVLIIAHESIPKRRITRWSDTSWTIEEHGYEDGPYDRINLDDDERLKNSNKKGTGRTITAQDSGGTALTTAFWAAEDAGRQVRIRHSDSSGGFTWGAALITSTPSPSSASVTVDVQENYEFIKASDNKSWRLGAIYPAEGYEQKLVMLGSRLLSSRDNRIFGTVSNDLNRYSPDVLDPVSDTFLVTDDSAIDIKMLDLQGVKIRWLQKDQVLHIGTDRGHYVLRGATAFGPITPSNVNIIKQSSATCAEIRPATLGNVFFIGSNKKKLYRSEYDFRVDRYKDIDITAVSPDILDGKAKKIVAMTDPWDMLWVLLEDGDLACLTYNEDLEIAAWTKHRHALGTIQDITVAKDTEGNDRLYMTVYDQTNYHVERMALFPEDANFSKSDYVLLDSVFQDSTSGTVSVIGDTTFNRFNGLTPYVMNNTVIHEDSIQVTNGGMTFNSAIDGGFEVGLDYEVTWKPLPLEYADTQDSTVGKRKQVVEAYMGLYNSLNIGVRQAGTGNGYEEVDFRDTEDNYSDTPGLFTGQKTLPVAGSASRELALEFKQGRPAPLWVNYIGYRLKVH